MLDVCHTEEFVDKAPRTICAVLLDRGAYLCSPRTMYRLLAGAQEIRERRNQARHPAYVKPELCARAPNQVWTWDITDLKGPARGHRYKLYMIQDLFSRLVVGWTIQAREDEALAREFHRRTLLQQGIRPGQLTLHADRGSVMTSGSLQHMLLDLQVSRSHSRPHVSNDNPYSEAQFKTLKYHPDFPERFGSIEDARAFCREFFDWYNHEHRHSGIGFMPPEWVHSGKARHAYDARQAVLDQAFLDHPERFPKGRPQPPPLPTEVWINPPKAA